MSRVGPMLVVVCPDGHAHGLTLTGEEQKRLLLELARARGVGDPGQEAKAGPARPRTAKKYAPRATKAQIDEASRLWRHGKTRAEICEATGLKMKQLDGLAYRSRDRFPKRHKTRED